MTCGKPPFSTPCRPLPGFYTQTGSPATTESLSESACPSLGSSVPETWSCPSHPPHPAHTQSSISWVRLDRKSSWAPASPSRKWGHKTPPHRAGMEMSLRRIINMCNRRHGPSHVWGTFGTVTSLTFLIFHAHAQPSAWPTWPTTAGPNTADLLSGCPAFALGLHGLSQIRSLSFSLKSSSVAPASRAKAEVRSRTHKNGSQSVFLEHHLGTCWKCALPGPASDLLVRNGGWGPVVCILTDSRVILTSMRA